MIDHDDPFTSSEVAASGSHFNGLWLSTSVLPARRATRGGDWCHTFAVSRNVLALSIGDVCGHGADQYAAMTRLRATIHSAAIDGLDPAQVLAEGNRYVYGLDPWWYATALFALLDTDTRTMTYANAGHPPPLIVGRSGSRFLTGSRPDLPLGIDANVVPSLHVAATPHNSLLVLYTDGVTERLRRPLAGEEELRSAATFAFANSKKPAAALIGELMNLNGSNDDDASILTARMGARPTRNSGAFSQVEGLTRAG